MLFAFHLMIACHAMFFESLLIYYLFHFFHFPFFCMPFLLFLPFLQSSVPVCRHNGDDRTGSSRLVSHSCLSYFSALLSGKTSLGRGSQRGRCSLHGKTACQGPRLRNTTWGLRLGSLSALVIPAESFAGGTSSARPAAIPPTPRKRRPPASSAGKERVCAASVTGVTASCIENDASLWKQESSLSFFRDA